MFTFSMPDAPRVVRRRFSPHKKTLTIYGIHDGYAEADPLLESLGPHTTGKGCVYLEKLEHADPDVLEQLVRNAWQSAAQRESP